MLLLSLHMRQSQALHCASCASGLVLAAELNRSVVLPDFLLDGYQPDAKEWITVDKAQVEPFGLAGVGSGSRMSTEQVTVRRHALVIYSLD